MAKTVKLCVEDEINPGDLVRKLKRQVASLQKKLVNAKKDGVRRSVKNYKRARARNRKDYVVTQTKLTERAQEYYFDKVKVDLIHKSHYIDGVTAFPIIRSFSLKHNMTVDQFTIFIVVCHHKWFSTTDGAYFGYTVRQVSGHMNKLVELGMVIKVDSKKNFYAASVKGDKLFREAQVFLTKGMKELMFALEDKFQNRTGNSGVKIKNNWIPKVNKDPEYKFIEEKLVK